mgnify:CR=1 FL=1
MLKPLFDNVVLEKEKQELKTASGIGLQEINLLWVKLSLSALER